MPEECAGGPVSHVAAVFAKEVHNVDSLSWYRTESPWTQLNHGTTPGRRTLGGSCASSCLHALAQ